MIEKQIRAIHRVPLKWRILHIDGTGSLVSIHGIFNRILNYVCLLKNLAHPDEPGFSVKEMASSSHTAETIETMPIIVHILMVSNRMSCLSVCVSRFF